MPRLITQILMGTPAPEVDDSLAASVFKAVAFRTALAFLSASLSPASAAAEARQGDLQVESALARPLIVCLFDLPGGQASWADYRRRFHDQIPAVSNDPARCVLWQHVRIREGPR